MKIDFKEPWKTKVTDLKIFRFSQTKEWLKNYQLVEKTDNQLY